MCQYISSCRIKERNDCIHKRHETLTRITTQMGYFSRGSRVWVGEFRTSLGQNGVEKRGVA